MAIYRFQEDDVFVNTVTTYPQIEFAIYNGSAYYNNEASTAKVQDYHGYANLYEYNIDRAPGSYGQIGSGESAVPNTGLIYPFLTKDGSRIAFRTITAQAFNAASIGDIMAGSYPLTATISKEYYPAALARQVPSTSAWFQRHLFSTGSVTHLYALKNTLNYNTYLSPHYAYSSSLGDLDTQDVGLISIPSIFYGSEIKKGTVDLQFYYTGSLIGRLQDTKRNGELIETVGTSVGSVAGVVLYGAGFVVLTGSWDLNTEFDNYTAGVFDNPKWIYFAQSISGSITAPRFIIRDEHVWYEQDTNNNHVCDSSEGKIKSL